MRRLIVLLIVFSSFYTCKKVNRINIEVANIKIDFAVERFDRIFAESTPNNLPKLKQEYPFMFSDRYPDSLWINRMKDTLQRQLYTETDQVFKNFEDEKKDITLLFQHLKYYS